MRRDTAKTNSLDTIPESFVHFFWTGKQPNNVALKGLFEWQKYLRSQNSDFQVRLWVDSNLFEIMKRCSGVSVSSDGDLLLKNNKRLPDTIRISNFSPLLESANQSDQYPELVRVYYKLINAKLYSFASSFARMLILDKYPGFYCDFDMRPKGMLPFPKSLTSLQEMIPQGNGAPDDFVVRYQDENQAMLSLYGGGFSHSLREARDGEYVGGESFENLTDNALVLYRKIMFDLRKVFEDDPFFRKSENRKYIERFFQIDNETEDTLSSELFENSTTLDQRIEIALAFSVLQCFFSISMLGHNTHGQYPALRDIMNKCFENPVQDHKQVFSWSHPIYFHLKKLHDAANVIGAFYLKHAKRADIQPVAKNRFSVFAKKNPSMRKTEKLMKSSKIPRK